VASGPPRWPNHFVDRNRNRIELHLCSQLQAGNRFHATSQGFFEAYDSSRQMPTGPIIAILAPRQERLPLSILNQEVHIDHRGQSANK
jgi:hypothetical protein